MNRDRDTEGLEYLRWSQFDSPDKKGSGFKYMERLPVMILDDIVAETRLIFNIELGYCTPYYSNKISLALNDSHRIGKAVRIRILNSKKRYDLVSGLIMRGVSRIGIGKETVYFDTDDQKPRKIFFW